MIMIEGKQIKSGSKATKIFEQIYRRYRLSVYCYLIMLCNKNEELASEIFSITMLSAYKSLLKLKYNGSIYNWIKRIAFNKYHDYLRSYYRQKKLRNNLQEINVNNKYEPHEIFLRKEQLRILNISLENLKLIYRTIIELKYYQGYSVIEIAKSINKSHGATRSLLQRAKKALRIQIVHLTSMQN